MQIWTLLLKIRYTSLPTLSRAFACNPIDKINFVGRGLPLITVTYQWGAGLKSLLLTVKENSKGFREVTLAE